MASHADVLRGSPRVPGEDCVTTQKNVCGGGNAGYGLSGVVRIPQRVGHPGVSHPRVPNRLSPRYSYCDLCSIRRRRKEVSNHHKLTRELFRMADDLLGIVGQREHVKLYRR